MNNQVILDALWLRSVSYYRTEQQPLFSQKKLYLLTAMTINTIYSSDINIYQKLNLSKRFKYQNQKVIPINNPSYYHDLIRQVKKAETNDNVQFTPKQVVTNYQIVNQYDISRYSIEAIFAIYKDASIKQIEHDFY